MIDLIDKQAAIETLKGLPTWWADEGGYYGGAQPPMVALLDPEDAVSAIENLPSAQPEIKPIGYQECANAMMKMWIDNVVTDGEYSRIMDKLNSYWRKNDG